MAFSAPKATPATSTRAPSSSRTPPLSYAAALSTSNSAENAKIASDRSNGGNGSSVNSIRNSATRTAAPNSNSNSNPSKHIKSTSPAAQPLKTSATPSSATAAATTSAPTSVAGATKTVATTVETVPVSQLENLTLQIDPQPQPQKESLSEPIVQQKPPLLQSAADAVTEPSTMRKENRNISTDEPTAATPAVINNADNPINNSNSANGNGNSNGAHHAASAVATDSTATSAPVRTAPAAARGVSSSARAASAGRAGSSSSASGKRPCMFFAQGTCRNGSECRFSHDLSIINNSSNSSGMHQRGTSAASSGVSAAPATAVAAAGGSMMPLYPPPPVLINIPPGQPVFSIDVECVATAVQHTARSIAQVALVDEWCRPVFNVYIKQDVPVMSYLHELTGLTKEILDQYGLPLAEAMAHLRSHLNPNAILVGQSIQKDVQWLQLAEGIDFHSLIDLSGLFRVWNSARGEYTNFSQDHCAKVWIGVQERTQHNAITDAAISMSLFNAYRTVQWDPPRLMQMQHMTLTAPRVPGFSAVHPVIDNCCMGNRKKCICGAPFH